MPTKTLIILNPAAGKGFGLGRRRPEITEYLLKIGLDFDLDGNRKHPGMPSN